MGVRRTKLQFEGQFVQVPNAWLRDDRLSRRAKGLLAELMTHSIGWHVTISSLQKSGTEGRDAIRNALNELKDAGYLRLVQSRGDKGRWNEVEYELCEPSTGIGNSDSGGFTDSGPADIGESDTKNTNSLEEQLEERDIRSIEREFEEWWSLYPRKQGKTDALKAFRQVRREVAFDVLMSGLQAYLLANIGQSKSYLKMPAGWLRTGRYGDEDAVTYQPSGRGQPAIDRNLAALYRYVEPECAFHEGYPMPCTRCAREALGVSDGRDF